MGLPRKLFLPAAILAAAMMAALSTEGAGSTNTTTLTISAKPNPTDYKDTTAITGTLEGAPKSQVKVKLEQSPAPFTDGFEQVAITTTDQSGNYYFPATPLLNTRYRTTTLIPAATSSEVLVKVRMKVYLRLSNPLPNSRDRIEFSGIVAPAHDGKLVYIQRRKRGRWRTVARTRLKDAGTTLSSYSRRVRVRRAGTYRARIRGDSDHAAGASLPKHVLISSVARRRIRA